MTNLLEQAINCNDGDLAAKIIRDALGIENDDVTNYCFPKDWPDTKEQLVYALQKLSNAGRSFSGRSAYLAIASDVLGYPAMLVDPFFGFRLGKKLAKKVLSVRPRHFDAPITFPRNRLKRCRIHESSPVIPIMRRFPEIFNESDPDRSGYWKQRAASKCLGCAPLGLPRGSLTPAAIRRLSTGKGRALAGCTPGAASTKLRAWKETEWKSNAAVRSGSFFRSVGRHHSSFPCDISAGILGIGGACHPSRRRGLFLRGEHRRPHIARLPRLTTAARSGFISALAG